MLTVYKFTCYLESQGYPPCSNTVDLRGEAVRPCRAGIQIENGEVKRMIYDIMLSRPEDYLSIYQSGCNHNCLKCHSWYFTQHTKGLWYTPTEIVKEALKYEEKVTIQEPRDRATMWHASELCAHCGSCIVKREYGPFCPRKLKPQQVILSPQGYGPARNIVSFTGGDLYCRPGFYIKTFRLLKKETNLWIHIETNGYGLVPRNLEELYSAGLDSIWLDMKAYSEDIYRKLCGTTNKWILNLPAEIIDMGITLEVILLYIPGLVEHSEIEKFANLIQNVNPYIPVTLLAFFPEYMMIGFRKPTYSEMVKAYRILESNNLKNVKLGNIGVFCRSTREVEKLISEIGREHVGL